MRMSKHQATIKAIIILDYGSQYTQLLARRIRELSVYCEVKPHTISKESLLAANPIGIILSGGPNSVLNEDAPLLPKWLFTLELPILGICYGMQALAVSLGGKVLGSTTAEYGYAKVNHKVKSRFLEGIQDGVNNDKSLFLDVWMSHGDHVTELPQGFTAIAETEDAPIAAMEHLQKPWFALQFHPEVTHTHQGTAILRRFVIDICQAELNWTHTKILDNLIANIKDEVKQDKVILALSGGVDSSVVAMLLHKAIGKRCHCIFVDNGLLRENEAWEVLRVFKENFDLEITAVDAKQEFLAALKGVTCPEEKRKKIGHTFIEIFEKEAIKLKNVIYLAQGTIYPDVIESAAGSDEKAAHVIKSHHNVGGLPVDLEFKLLEPVRTLFKDEVRQLGLDLGLPKHLLYRHPFPGPGLAVRVLGEVKEEYLAILRQADKVFIEALYEANLYTKVSQAFAVFLPVKSVAVLGDGRVYDYVICLRAVETHDFMTAKWAKLPWDFLDEVARKIMNRVGGISRVTYDISGKPPATIEWE